MTDTTLLDGTVDDVKAGLAGADATTLTALLAAEQAGQNRKDVIDAIETAQAALPAGVTYTAHTDSGDGNPVSVTDIGKAAETDAVTASGADLGSDVLSTAATLDDSPAADIAPATAFEPSGAPLQSSGFDVDHPALDTNPRANTTETMNRIDFNDPTRSGQEIVEEQLQAGKTA